MNYNETGFNPFPGLRSFEEEEEYLFFGREKQIDELVNKLSKTRFLAVLGASGSGKSSLVKSGLLPSLHSGFLATAGSGWRICTFRPGNDPIGNLALAIDSEEILGLKKEREIAPALIESILRRNDNGIGECLKQLSEAHRHNILIVVDQFEELFRFTKYEKAESKEIRDSVSFINLLLAASRYKELPIYVVFTMRSDFLGDCTEFRGLPEAINDGQYLIPRMTREERKSAIVGPISVGGASISQTLLTRLLNDVGDNPDQLPILQHALMRTWEYWAKHASKNETIDLVHYESIGTMSKALSLHAEEAYSEVGGDKEKETCKKLFKALTEKRDDGRGIRRPCQIKEISELAEVKPEEIIRIIEIFRMPGRSLLMPPVGSILMEDSVIDISHESLMRVWDRLISWVQEEIESAELYCRLAESAALYQEGKTGLWRDPELQMAINWKLNQNPNKIWANRYDPSFERALNFLNYSEAEKKKELKAAEKKRKAAIATLRVFVSLIALALCFVIYYAFGANQAKEKATKAWLLSDSLRIEAERAAKSDSLKTIKADSLTKVAIAERKKADTLALKALTANEQTRQLMLAAIEDKKIADAQAQKISNLFEQEQKSSALQRLLKDSLQITNNEVLSSKKDAETLRLLAEAKNIAIKSSQLNNDPQTSLQLAFLAFAINTDLNGSNQNRTVYDALKSRLNQAYMDSSRMRLDRTIESSAYDVRTVAFINENNFVTAGDDGIIKKWTLSGSLLKIKAVTKSAKSNEYYCCLGLSPDKKIVVAGSTGGAINIWNHESNYALPNTLFKGLGKVSALNFIPSPDHYKLIVVFSSAAYVLRIDKSNLQLIDQKKIQIVHSATHHLNAFACHNKANNSKIFISSGKTVYVLYDDKNGSYVNAGDSITFNENVTALSVSNDGAFLAVGGLSGSLMVYQLLANKHKEFKNIRGHLSAITRLMFSSNDSLLVSGSMDHSIYVNNARKKDEDNLVLKEKDVWIRDLAYSPSNEYIIAVGQLGLVQVWPASIEIAFNRVNKFKKYHQILMDKPNEAKIKEEIGEKLFEAIYKNQNKTSFMNYWTSIQSRYLN